MSIDQKHAFGNILAVFQAGSRIQAQPFAMRAPEVWQGQACTEPSQVWALAAMLLCWIKPGILGTPGCPMPLLNETWCIAKLMRLLPSWTIPPLEDENRQNEFNLAKALNERTLPQLCQMSVLEDEILKVDMPTELRDLLQLMLVVNPDERPSATHVLASKEFWALDKALADMK
ncbi:hypothetical protein EMCG_04314 [[Emmonsia] crescens]|uniref:Protein kinase domain-containing protein n=1 Tax=[Emmonsia] crescens TaxID=73230 RepID=A0A0G2HTL6_9EURO|nr:hypothetical protein EMCG_04314 [Emmonsia crescens UAMH 3008]